MVFRLPDIDREYAFGRAFKLSQLSMGLFASYRRDWDDNGVGLCPKLEEYLVELLNLRSLADVLAFFNLTKATAATTDSG